MSFFIILFLFKNINKNNACNFTLNIVRAMKSSKLNKILKTN